ncbi:MAG: DUF5996 family protein [Pseudomonadota bacterium]
MQTQNGLAPFDWPELTYDKWRDTCEALHLWSQIVGKYRLRHAHWVNHSWHATLYVTSRGLTTRVVPDPQVPVTVSFDFCDDRLVVETAGGQTSSFTLEGMSVAEFRNRFQNAIENVGGSFNIHERPNEVPDPIPFRSDTGVRPYDADAVHRFHWALLLIQQVFDEFRTGFHGKVSPTHLFWGSFDLAVTRFSGRDAPRHPGGVPNLPDDVTHEAYSHEVSSAGFWPGNGYGEAMFYSYAYPTPPAMRDQNVTPDAAFWSKDLGEFLLPYDVVRKSSDPRATLMDFLQSTYAAAATAGKWDRAGLERPLGVCGSVNNKEGT